MDGDQEPQSSGRLLHFRFGEWIHVNCALWSSEVYEAVDNSLVDVAAAASETRFTILFLSQVQNKSYNIKTVFL